MEKVNVEKVAEEIAEKSNGSLIQGNPEDYGIGEYGSELSVPEKHSQLMETSRHLLERKHAKLEHKVVDEALKRNITKVPTANLLDKAIKMRPQKTESAGGGTIQNFMQFVLEAHAEKKKYDTIDVKD